MDTNKENFLKLVSKEKNNIMNSVRHRIRFRRYYRIKSWIILKYLMLRDKF